MDFPKKMLTPEYWREKDKVLEVLRSLGVPESMLRTKTLEELNALLDRYGGS